ncbi:MAG: hypothetical protein JNK33_04495 [Candidatus Doudnabacteria bacterium]|nr:hypothetical protein [Candidatus Doudnabacteria bacterium]
MELSTYHQKYAAQPNAEIDKKILAKQSELEAVFSTLSPAFEQVPLKIAVLGCGDKRFVPKHRELFSFLLQKPIELTTFDITTDHLEGEDGVMRHDCTLPLPNGPYDITYAHVLLKFIEPTKQVDVLYNSHQALREHGLAIHVLDTQDYEGEHPLVNLATHKTFLQAKKIAFTEIPVHYGLALVLHN